jgi:hypothetical protein
MGTPGWIGSGIIVRSDRGQAFGIDEMVLLTCNQASWFEVETEERLDKR